MKKLLAVFLSVCMLTSAAFVAHAEDEYTAIDCTINMDGADIPCESGYTDEFYDYYRYTSVAEALGYTVTFDSETGLVQTAGNDAVITFDTLGNNAMRTIAGTDTEEFGEYLTYMFLNRNDMLYISPVGIRTLLVPPTECDVKVHTADNTIHVYSPEGKRLLAEELNKKFSVLSSMQAEMRDKDYVTDGTCIVSLNIGSEFFGIEGSGQTVMDITSAKHGKKTYTKVHTEGDGLMNLFSLLAYTETSYDTPETFPSTSDIEVYYNGTNLYVKGEQPTRELLSNEDYRFSYRYTDAADEIIGQWIYLPDLPEGYEAMLDGGGNIGQYLVEYAFHENNGVIPEDMISVFELLLGDDNFTVTNDAKGKTYTYTLNKDKLFSALEPMFAEMTEGERIEMEKQLSYFGFDITVVQNTNKKGGVNLTEGNIRLSNIENPWNEQVFSLDITIESSENVTFSGADTFAFPDVSKAIDIKAYAEKVITEREIFAE